MKKLSLILVCSASLFAASNSEISDFYSKSIKAQFPNATVMYQIVKRLVIRVLKVLL